MKVEDPKLAAYARTVSALHEKWKPHSGQIRVGQAHFRDGIMSIFVQCGRKWGKTELALYFLWRIAQTYPNSPCYYIAPLMNQAKEIVWADPRLQTFGPRDWLMDGSLGVNNTEMRLRFKNGSFIKVDGSENYDKYRGPKFRICVYEEYKDMKPQFRKAMRPNSAVLQGLELFIGSPPDRDCEYVTLAEEHRTDESKLFYQAPTWENPGIDKGWLDKEKKQLYARGEGDVWEREYAAKYVKGGASKIFPMIDTTIVRPHDQVLAELRRDRKKLQFMAVADPAAATCFGVLFLALNPYTRQLYALNEIYEKDQGKMSVRQIGGRILKITEADFFDQEWRHIYDEAESWWRNEWMEHFSGAPMAEPSQKALNDKDAGLSLIKDILLAERFIVSSNCKHLFLEMDNYFKDDKGKIPKVNDHLIDCLRYGLGALHYSLTEEKEHIESEDEDFRGARISDDFPGYDDMGAAVSEWEEYN